MLEIPGKFHFCDGRPSGTELLQGLKTGLEVFDCIIKDFGLATTPQLHYYVLATNTQNTKDSYGVPSEEGYYKKFSDAFNVFTVIKF